MLRESEAYGPSSFQSTLSMRRATATVRKINRDVNISIHALHEESDLWRECRQPSSWNFNPRSP